MNSALFVVTIPEASILFSPSSRGRTSRLTAPLTSRAREQKQRRRRSNVQPVCCESTGKGGSGNGYDNSSNSNSGEKKFVPAWKQMTMDQDVAANSELIRLEESLDSAWYADDKVRMAELRKEIDSLQPTSCVDVLSANLKFYEAFSRGSVRDIGSCWLQDADVMCKHPLGPLFVGFWDIMQSFEALFQQGVADVRPDNIRISVRGSVALVTCDEDVKAKIIPINNQQQDAATKYNPNFSPEKARIRMTAVNIFEKRNGAYYMVYHMSSPVSPLID